MGKEAARSEGDAFDPWVGKTWQPTPMFLSGEFQGQRSLSGYSPWGHKESDTTEMTDRYN